MAGNFLFEDLAHETDAGQMLAQTVMEILADSSLLPAAYFENLSFQALSPCNIPDDRQDIVGRAGNHADLEILPFFINVDALLEDLRPSRYQGTFHISHDLIDRPPGENLLKFLDLIKVLADQPGGDKMGNIELPLMKTDQHALLVDLKHHVGNGVEQRPVFGFTLLKGLFRPFPDDDFPDSFRNDLYEAPLFFQKRSFVPFGFLFAVENLQATGFFAVKENRLRLSPNSLGEGSALKLNIFKNDTTTGDFRILPGLRDHVDGLLQNLFQRQPLLFHNAGNGIQAVQLLDTLF
ncbi:MAG: hypothetical protein A4E66_02619 [Syntrophus sp. PtaB.Bin001]|nr:MAG: hypothetical protein A4E66_02619 [Syntrophus sp. PtaB.Bin001]